MIKKLIENLFRKQKPDTAQSASGNSISFFIDLDKDSEPNVKIVVTDTSEEACKRFSELLFDLNSGEYYKSMLELLLTIGKQDSEIQKFTENTMLCLNYLFQIKNKGYKKSKIQLNSKPLIMPTDFNRNAKQ